MADAYDSYIIAQVVHIHKTSDHPRFRRLWAWKTGLVAAAEATEAGTEDADTTGAKDWETNAAGGDRTAEAADVVNAAGTKKAYTIGADDAGTDAAGRDRTAEALEAATEAVGMAGAETADTTDADDADAALEVRAAGGVPATPALALTDAVEAEGKVKTGPGAGTIALDAAGVAVTVTMASAIVLAKSSLNSPSPLQGQHSTKHLRREPSTRRRRVALVPFPKLTTADGDSSAAGAEVALGNETMSGFAHQPGSTGSRT